jgi:hypothetical protein
MDVILNENRLAGRGGANRGGCRYNDNHGWFVICLIDSLRKLFAERALQRLYSIIFTYINHMYNSYSTPIQLSLTYVLIGII